MTKSRKNFQSKTVNCEDFFRNESLKTVKNFIKSDKVTLDSFNKSDLMPQESWQGSISFDLGYDVSWRLDVLFHLNDARSFCSYATGIAPRILSMGLIQTCMGEVLNLIAGPVKTVATNKMKNKVKISQRPMLPKFKPFYKQARFQQLINLNSASWQIVFPTGSLHFECFWTDLFPKVFAEEDLLTDEGEIELLI